MNLELQLLVGSHAFRYLNLFKSIASAKEEKFSLIINGFFFWGIKLQLFKNNFKKLQTRGCATQKVHVLMY